MKTIKVIFLLILLPSLSFSQGDSLKLNLIQQYEDLKLNTETFNDFKVIRETRLDNWFQTIQDSINVQKETNESLRTSIGSLEDSLDQIRSRMQSLEDEQSQGEFEKTHIAVMGINFSKSAYKAMSLISIVGLLIVLSFLIIKVINSGKTTRDTIKQHQELNDQFEEYKKRALEKQTKLARELQTERNKLEEFKRKK